MSSTMPPPAPRAFPFSAIPAGAQFLLLFGGIWAFVGVTVAIVFTVVGGPPWDDWILDKRGVAVEARPTKVEPTSSRINGKHVVEISYRYVAAGHEHEGSSGTTSDTLIASARANQPLTVIYDPESPARARLEGSSASFFGAFLLIPLFFAIVGSVIFALGYSKLRQVREIYTNGVPVEATITAIERTAMRVNRRRLHRARYVFKAMEGEIHGEMTSVSPPAVGAKIWVLHLPTEPKRNVAA